MLHFWWFPALLFNMLFTTLIGINGLRPYHNQTLENLLGSIESCETICWSGIRPGFTSLSALRQELSNHAWVGGQEYNASTPPNSGALVWTWNLPPDVPLDESRRGIAGLRVGIVTYIQLPTRLTYGEFWLARGQPLRGQTLGLGSGRSYNSLRHYVAYSAGDEFQVRIIVTCPFNAVSIWNAPVDIWLGMQSDIPLSDYQFPSAAECGEA